MVFWIGGTETSGEGEDESNQSAVLTAPLSVECTPRTLELLSTLLQRAVDGCGYFEAPKQAVSDAQFVQYCSMLLSVLRLSKVHMHHLIRSGLLSDAAAFPLPAAAVDGLRNTVRALFLCCFETCSRHLIVCIA